MKGTSVYEDKERFEGPTASSHRYSNMRSRWQSRWRAMRPEAQLPCYRLLCSANANRWVASRREIEPGPAAFLPRRVHPCTPRGR